MTCGDTRSCGCLLRESASARFTTHGLTRKDGKKTSIYLSYQDAKARCRNPTHRWFKAYGGRGIEFRFACFEDYLAELGPKPADTSLSVDRINNDGHYEVGNLRWADKKTQSRNQRR